MSNYSIDQHDTLQVRDDLVQALANQTIGELGAAAHYAAEPDTDTRNEMILTVTVGGGSRHFRVEISEIQ